MYDLHTLFQIQACGCFLLWSYLLSFFFAAETDEDNTTIEETTDIHIKQVKSNETNTVYIEKIDKATQAENVEKTTMSVGENSDVTLSEVRLKDFWNILNAHISQQISTALKTEANSKAAYNHVLMNTPINIPAQNSDLETNVPMAHMQLRQHSYDSGMYSVSSMYSGAPENYV